MLFCSHCCQMSCTNEYIRRIPVSFLSLYYNGWLLEYNSRLPLIQYKNAQISLHLPVYFWMGCENFFQGLRKNGIHVSVKSSKKQKISSAPSYYKLLQYLKKVFLESNPPYWCEEDIYSLLCFSSLVLVSPGGHFLFSCVCFYVALCRCVVA